MYYKSEVQISTVTIGKSQEGEIKYADAAGSPVDAADAYQNTFPMDTDMMIKNIKKKKITLMKIFQDLKDFDQDVLSKKENDTRMYTPGSASEFKIPEDEGK